MQPMCVFRLADSRNAHAGISPTIGDKIMRKFLKHGLCALALSSTMMSGALRAEVPAKLVLATKQTTPQRPNIILILSDDNSVPHDGCHPNQNTRTNNVTPNLEAFAAQSMCFDRAYSTSPQCAPSRGSIFAGRNPVDIGITRFGQPARLDVRYFSDMLRSAGYWVGLDGRNHHLAGREGDPPHVKKVLEETGLSRIQDRVDYVNVYGTKNVAPAKIASQVSETLDKVPAQKPFFLYFGFSEPHRPFVSDHSNIDATKLKLPPDWPDLPAVREDYAGMLSDVRMMDGQFGALMAMLKAKGLADNTIIVFMGDNGESMYRGKGTLYERGNHVPLIVRWPGVVKSGSRNGSLVSGIDLAETFLEAAGLKPDPRMTGISLVPLLKGQTKGGHDYVFSERGEHPGSITVSEGVDYMRSITGQRYKLIYNAQPNQPYSPVDQGGRFLAPDAKQAASKDVLPAVALTDDERSLGGWGAVVRAHEAKTLSPLFDRIYFQRPRPIFELYDLATDPYEFNNLAGKPELKATEINLREELDKWMALSADYLAFATDAYRETPDPTHSHP
jgi:N-sulfoglucosamine sulfohydrolase